MKKVSSSGMTNGFGRMNRQNKIRIAIACANMLLLSQPLLALPQNGSVVAGSVTLQSSATTLNVQQQSAKAIINWQGFDIQANESVTFVQPSISSVTLNRVTGTNPSAILGKMQANGQVFLVNPNGVTFAPGAQVEVGALVASTLNINDSDFLSGNYQFQSNGALGAILNQGNINANTIALLGNQVTNQGWLVASSSVAGDAAVVMAAGDRIKLSFGSDKLLAVDIQQGTYDALVDNQQLIHADGGQVLLRAEAADALLGAAVNNSGVIQAQGIAEKEGKIILLADMNVGTTTLTGTLDVSSSTGNGGFVETSAATVTVKKGAVVNTQSLLADSGLWLIDPKDVTIDNSGAVGSLAVSALQTALAAGSVTVQTTSEASAVAGNGDIKVNSDLTWSTNNSVLTLQAERNIEINAVITATGNFSGVTLDTGLSYNSGSNWNKAYSAAEFAQDQKVIFGTAGEIALSGSNAVYDRDGQVYQMINSEADLAAINTVDHFALGSDITLTGAFTPLTASLQGFDGLGHSINNLTISQLADTDVGLFEQAATDSYFRNTTLDGTVAGDSNVGAVVGTGNNLTIDNVHSTVQVLATTLNLGGLVGTGDSVNIYNSSVKADIGNGSAEATGGLIGNATNTKISGSEVVGTVYGAKHVGGLLGLGVTVNVTDSLASGEVRGDKNLGGIAGRATTNSTFENVSYAGKVWSNTNAQKLGGIVGYLDDSTISKSHSSGSVSGTSSASNGGSVGGIVGLLRDITSGGTTSVTQSYSLSNIEILTSGAGTISTNTGVAGVVGRTTSITSDKVYITDVYALGDVKVKSNDGAVYYPAGGIVGFANEAVITNGYFGGQVKDDLGATDTGGITNRGALVGKATNSTIATSYWNSAQNTDGFGIGESSSSHGLNAAQLIVEETHPDFKAMTCEEGSVGCFAENNAPLVVVNGGLKLKTNE